MPPAFDPLSLPECNATLYPAPYNEARTRRFNRSDKDGLLLAVGDRSDGDVVTYADVDMHLIRGQGMFHKDGRKYE